MLSGQGLSLPRFGCWGFLERRSRRGGKYERVVCNRAWQKGFPEVEALATHPRDRLIILSPQKTLLDSDNQLTVVLVMMIPLNCVGLLYREVLFLFLVQIALMFHV